MVHTELKTITYESTKPATIQNSQPQLVSSQIISSETEHTVTTTEITKVIVPVWSVFVGCFFPFTAVLCVAIVKLLVDFLFSYPKAALAQKIKNLSVLNWASRACLADLKFSILKL